MEPYDNAASVGIQRILLVSGSPPKKKSILSKYLGMKHTGGRNEN